MAITDFDLCAVKPTWWRRLIVVLLIVPMYVFGMIILLVLGLIRVLLNMREATLEYPAAVVESWRGYDKSRGMMNGKGIL